MQQALRVVLLLLEYFPRSQANDGPQQKAPISTCEPIQRCREIDDSFCWQPGPPDDQGRIIQTAQECCREHLRAKRSFVFNATNLMRQTRSRWINLFADCHAVIELVYLEPLLCQLLEQNRDRNESVPESVIRKLAGKIEPPNLLEGHRVQLLDQP